MSNGNGTPSKTATGNPPPKSLLDRIANFRFETFVPDKDNWKYYLERFELEMSLLQLNGDELVSYRRDLLLRSIGSELYRTVAEHFNPKSVSTLTYSELTTFLTSHNTKPVSYIIARCEFGQCVRDSNMSIAEFLAKLRSLAPDCQFGATLDERLRDQFLIGLKNPSMLERISELHRSPSDKLVDIVDTALNIEAAQRQRAAFETNLSSNSTPPVSTTNQVNLVRNPNPTSKKPNRNKSSKKRADFKNNSSAPPSSSNANTPNPPSNANNSSSNVSNNVNQLNPSQHCLRCGGNRHAKASDCKVINATCRAC